MYKGYKEDIYKGYKEDKQLIKKYFSIIKQIINYFIKFNKKDIKKLYRN